MPLSCARFKLNNPRDICATQKNSDGAPAMSRDIALNPASDDASPRFSPGLLRRFHP